MELDGPQLDKSVGLAAQLGMKLSLVVGQPMNDWKQQVSEHECSLLTSHCADTRLPDYSDPFLPSEYSVFKNISLQG